MYVYPLLQGEGVSEQAEMKAYTYLPLYVEVQKYLPEAEISHLSDPLL